MSVSEQVAPGVEAIRRGDPLPAGAERVMAEAIYAMAAEIDRLRNKLRLTALAIMLFAVSAIAAIMRAT